MRNRFGFLVVWPFLTVTLFAADPPAKPMAVLPPPKAVEATTSPAQVEALKNELESLIREREAAAKPTTDDPASLSERMKLKSKVLSLIDRIELKKTPIVPMPPAKPVESSHSSSPKLEIAAGTTDRDKLRTAENLFRAGDVEAAYRIFNFVDLSNLARDERTFPEYLKACCLRKLGKTSEAKAIYRKIADDKDDSFWVECSLSQLQLLTSADELEERLKILRAGKRKP
jgi:hypothetical protein